MILVVFHEIGFKIPKFDDIKEYLNFAFPIIPNNLSTWIVESSDRLSLEYLRNVLCSILCSGIYFRNGHIVIFHSSIHYFIINSSKIYENEI